MFGYCAEPELLDNLRWLSCYLTTVKHANLYSSVLTVIALLAVTAPTALLFGLCGATAARSGIAPIRWFGQIYINIVRGVPDIAFFLFFVIALDQGLEYLRHISLCPDWSDLIRQGNDFVVCKIAKLPLSSAPAWVHELYGFALAVITFAIVFGAFAANVIFGAMQAVPAPQIETANAYGMSSHQTFWRILLPQMWGYALPGLSNLWMILVKATPLLFLLGIEDVVFWARELGSFQNPKFTQYPHGDWRIWYFLALLVFYLLITWCSERVFDKLTHRLSRGQSKYGSLQ